MLGSGRTGRATATKGRCGLARRAKGGWGLRLLLSVGIIVGLLIWLVDWEEAGQALARADWRLLGLMALWMFLDRLVMAYKWRLLLVHRGLAVTSGEALLAYLLATFAGYFLPSTVGADAMRILALAGPERPSELLTASVMMERGLGFVAAALAALVSLALLLALATHLPAEVSYWAAGILVLACLGMLVSLYGPLNRWLASLPGRMGGRGKLAGWLGRFLAAYAQYRRHPWLLLYFLLLSFLEQGAPVVATWLVAWGLGLPVTFLTCAAVVPLANLLARVPISVSTHGHRGGHVRGLLLPGGSGRHLRLPDGPGDEPHFHAHRPARSLYYLARWRRGGDPADQAGKNPNPH